MKKICISTNKGNLSLLDIDDIKNLSAKESNFWFDLKTFQDFEQQVYNKDLLKQVTFSSIFYFNLLDLYWKNDNILEIRKIKDYYDNFYKYFIYESNKTEWSRIPFSEIKKLFEIWKTSYKNKNEIQEVINSKKAWDFLLNEFTFTKAKIKRLYHILTKDLLQETGDKYPRWFRKVNVIVVNDLVLDWKNIDKAIDNLLLDYKEKRKTDFPLKLAFDFYLKFEKIHPFENGNGRIWRLILNKILIENKFFSMIIYSENK